MVKCAKNGPEQLQQVSARSLRLLDQLIGARKQGVRDVEPERLCRFDEAARRELAKGTGVLKTAKLVGLGTGTVQRLKYIVGRGTVNVTPRTLTYPTTARHGANGPGTVFLPTAV